MKFQIILLLLFFLSSCSDTAVQEELSKTKVALKEAYTTIDQLKNQIEPEGELVHLVFFKTKPDVDLKSLFVAIEKLKEIEVVKDLQVGPFENLGDQRALSEYTVLMEMSFDHKAAYEKYQAHPIHLALKESLGKYLAGPPATYDYLKN